MKKFKSMVTLLCVIALSTSLFAGCGSKQTSETVADPQKEYEIKFPSFWVGKDSKAKVVGELITKFNETNKGKIKVTVEEIADYNAYEDKMKTSIATDTVPDIFIFKSGTIAELYYKSGKLMDFTSAMNGAWKDSFVGDSIKQSTYNSQVLSIPYEYGVTPVIYNQKLLSQAGVNGFPKNYTEFFDMCDKLVAKGIAPMSQMTGENAWTTMLWYSQLVVSIGGPDVYSRGLDDPAFLEAAKVMQKMFKYTTKDAVGAGAAVAAGHFLNEQTAILMNGPWFIGRIKKEGINNMYNEVSVAPAPLYEGGKGKSDGYIGFVQSNIGAAKQKDKGKEEAVIKFLKYLTDPINIKAIATDSGSMFVIKTEAKADDKVEKLQGMMMAQTNSAPYVVPHFQLMVKAAVGNEFPQAIAGLVAGGKTPEQFIKQLKDKEN